MQGDPRRVAGSRWPGVPLSTSIHRFGSVGPVLGCRVACFGFWGGVVSMVHQFRVVSMLVDGVSGAWSAVSGTAPPSRWGSVW